MNGMSLIGQHTVPCFPLAGGFADGRPIPKKTYYTIKTPLSLRGTPTASQSTFITDQLYSTCDSSGPTKIASNIIKPTVFALIGHLFKGKSQEPLKNQKPSANFIKAYIYRYRATMANHIW